MRPFHARGNVYIIDRLTTKRVNPEQRLTYRGIDPFLGFPWTLAHLRAGGLSPWKMLLTRFTEIASPLLIDISIFPCTRRTLHFLRGNPAAVKVFPNWRQ